MKKKLISIILFLVCLLTIHAQDLSLSIEIVAGGLKDAMTQEQRQTVTDLTLIGSMDDSDFYLIRDEMFRLVRLDMKQVKVDTIPKNALYSSSNIDSIVLPMHVKYIKDNAFSDMSYCVVTDSFPKLGAKVFSSMTNVMVSDDNKVCKKAIDESIYSIDGKIFYYYNRNPDEMFLGTIAEGTEIIASRAFDSGAIRELVFPSSLKEIGKDIFANSEETVTTRGVDYRETSLCLNFKSKVPPLLSDGAFDYKDIHYNVLWHYFVRVPKGCVDIYKNSDPQWSVFENIVDDEEYRGNISSNAKHPLSIVRAGNYWTLSSETRIKKIEVMVVTGVLSYSKECNDTSVQFPCESCQGIYCVKVLYEDGTINVAKIMN